VLHIYAERLSGFGAKPL